MGSGPSGETSARSCGTRFRRRRPSSRVPGERGGCSSGLVSPPRPRGRSRHDPDECNRAATRRRRTESRRHHPRVHRGPPTRHVLGCHCGGKLVNGNGASNPSPTPPRRLSPPISAFLNPPTSPSSSGATPARAQPASDGSIAVDNVPGDLLDPGSTRASKPQVNHLTSSSPDGRVGQAADRPARIILHRRRESVPDRPLATMRDQRPSLSAAGDVG